jgi:fructose-1,6-bisphosphatase I
MSFLVEQAGGTSITAGGGRTMDIQPRELHERVALVLGSRDEVAAVARFVK